MKLSIARFIKAIVRCNRMQIVAIEKQVNNYVLPSRFQPVFQIAKLSSHNISLVVVVLKSIVASFVIL